MNMTSQEHQNMATQTRISAPTAQVNMQTLPKTLIQEPSTTLQYRVDFFDVAGHRLRVYLHIDKPDPIAQKVFLPSWIPGSYLIRDFSRHIETFTAQNKQGACEVTQPDNHSWVIHNSNDAIDIEIVVYAWDLSVRGAHIDQHHAFFNGTSIFLGVEGQTQQPCEVLLTAPAELDHWQTFTSMPHMQTDRPGKTHHLGRYHAPNYDAFIDYPFEIGTPQTIKFIACGAQHQLVFTGHIPNLDLARIRVDVKRICESQIKLFEPKTQRAPFLDSAPVYTFLTLVTGEGYGGLEHRASTALLTSRHSLPTLGQLEAPKAYSDFLGLVSHEYFHTWHVKRIKPNAFVPYDLTQPNHTSLLWVFEGITSYYDDLTLVRTGLLTEKLYFKRLGETIAGVLRQPGRFKQSVAQSSFEAWTKYYKQDENAPNAISSYYAKGSLVALCIDLSIRAATNNKRSLDDVMRYLWKHYGCDFYHKLPPLQDFDPDTESASNHLKTISHLTTSNKIKSRKQPTLLHQFGLDENDFAQIVQHATGVNLTKQINAWATGTTDLPLKKCFAFAGIALSWKAQEACPSIDANVKPAGANLILSHVFENGTAHRAGLSAHDILIAIDSLKVGGTRDNLNQIMARYRPKDQVDVTVFRGDVLHTFTVTLVAPALNLCTLTRV